MKYFTRVSLVVLASSLLIASQASAEDKTDAGWDTDFGILFSVNNVFTRDGVLGSYQGYGLGGLLFLNPTMAVRTGLSLARSSNPVFETTVVDTAADGTVTETKSLGGRGGPTSTFDLALGADFLMRASTGALSPYFGGGLRLAVGSSKTAYEDKGITTTNVDTTVDDSESTLSLQLRGILGVDWRVHERFSFFAEYNLGIGLVNSTSTKENTSTTDSTGATPQTTSRTSSGKRSSAFTLSTGLVQGASLGLVAFF